MSWSERIDSAAYVGNCNKLKPRDVTQQLKNSVANAQKNGAKVTAVDCFED